MPVQDLALVFMGLAFLLIGIFGKNFNWTYGVAIKKGPPAPSWFGRLVFSSVGLAMLVFESGHLAFGWTGL
jgi:hypothetical protein